MWKKKSLNWPNNLIYITTDWETGRVVWRVSKISIDNERNFEKLLLTILVIYFQFFLLKWRIYLYMIFYLFSVFVKSWVKKQD